MNTLKKLFMTKNKSCLSLVLGAISALAMPPFCAFPLLFITFPIMLYIFQSAENKKKAFFYGWLFGLGYFVFGTYWISNAIINDFPYFVPFAILGLPMFLAIYTGLTGLITKVMSKKISGLLLVLAFAVVFVLMELARGFVFTGFPWNLTAYAWSNYLSVMQVVSVVGIYGLSFISVLLFSLPYLFLTKSSKKLPAIINSVALICLIGSGVVGHYRLKNNMQVSIFNKKVLFVQPSIPIEVSDLDSMDSFYRYAEMTENNLTDDVDIIVWGETAIPFALNEYPNYRKFMGELIPDGAVLLTGSIRSDAEGNYYNSIIAVGSDGDILADYDKSHLVPFGEYMPFEDTLPLEKIVGFDFVFSKGQGRKTIKIDGLPSFSPLVCY